jgi:hypothetical protein
MPIDPGERGFLFTPQERQRIRRRVAERWLKSEAGQHWQKERKRQKQIHRIVRAVVWINKRLIVVSVGAMVLTLVGKLAR